LRSAIIISFVFHAVIMASSMIGLPMLNRDKPMQMKVIPVEMVTIGKVTKLKAQEKKPDPKKKKMPPKEKQQERKVAMPPEPPKLASNMPLPDMTKKPEKPVKKAEKSVLEKANRAPRITPKSKPSRFDSGKLSALLDKREKAEPDIVEQLKDKTFGKEKIVGTIDIQQQTLGIIDAVGQHIFNNQCWNIPAGAKGAEGLVVTIEVRLSLDGNLVGTPKIMESGRMNMPGQEFFRTAAESALRAVRKCAPYDFLPKDQFDLWRDLEISFDPENMLNG